MCREGGFQHNHRNIRRDRVTRCWAETGPKCLRSNEQDRELRLNIDIKSCAIVVPAIPHYIYFSTVGVSDQRLLFLPLWVLLVTSHWCSEKACVLKSCRSCCHALPVTLNLGGIDNATQISQRLHGLPQREPGQAMKTKPLCLEVVSAS